jgi:hypothetical protein
MALDMLYALAWFSVLALLAFWSLAAWALHALLSWAAANAGAVASTSVDLGGVPWPQVLAPWVPPELTQWLSSVAMSLRPLADTALAWAPTLAGGLTVVTWIVWAIGAALLLVLGIALHLLILLWRRRSGGGSGPRAGHSLAAG